MDFRVSCTLVSVVMFVLLASKQAYSMIKKQGVTDDNQSLAIRAILFALLTHVVCSML